MVDDILISCSLGRYVELHGYWERGQRIKHDYTDELYFLLYWSFADTVKYFHRNSSHAKEGNKQTSFLHLSQVDQDDLFLILLLILVLDMARNIGS